MRASIKLGERRVIIRTVIGLILLLIALTLYAYTSGAISKNYYPVGDTSGTIGKTEVTASVGASKFVPTAEINLKAYFSKRSTNNKIKILDYAFCPSNSKYEDNGSAKKGDNITKYTIDIPGVKNVIVKYGKSLEKCKDTLTIDVDIPKGTDPNKDTGLYEVSIRAVNVKGDYHKNNNPINMHNTFKVTIDGSGSYKVSHTGKKSGAKGSEVTVEQTNANPSNIDYNINFGADCKVTEKNTIAKVELYDIDNLKKGDTSGTQLNGYVKIKLQGKSGNKWTTLDISLQNPNKKNTELSKSITPKTKSGATTNIYFKANPNEKYRLTLENVYHNNTIQFNTPYDGIYYERDCKRWSLTPKTEVRKCGTTNKWKSSISVKKDDKVCFRHVVVNTQAGSATSKGQPEFKWGAKKAITTGWNKRGHRDKDLASSEIKKLEINSNHIDPRISNFVIPGPTVAKNGDKYCMRYTVDPATANGGSGAAGTATSSPACAVVGGVPDDEPEPSQFSLKPKINIDKRTYAYYPNIAAAGAIETESGTVSGNHDWEVYAIRYSSAPATSSLTGDSSADVCSKIPATNRTTSDCASARIYSGTYPAVDQNNPELIYNSGGPDAVGANICFFTRVKDPTHVDADNNSWRYSNMECAVAGVYPKIQVWGGDVTAEGEIQTTVADIGTDSDRRKYGSWGEYGVFSGGINDAMGSGVGLKNTSSDLVRSMWSGLTFGNADDPDYGMYGSSLPLTSVDAAGARVISGDAKVSELPGLNLNSKQVFMVNGTLTIDSELKYNDKATSVGKIPRVILIAENILINDNIARIDPWLVTTSGGAISTCKSVGFKSFADPEVLKSTSCNKQIVFNGPVISEKVYLYRTYSDDEGGAAETFNLRADNILSSYASGSSANPIAITTSISEVSPRF